MSLENNKNANILQAALTLFAERGYDGTTIPMIAGKAKVGAGTIYRYFENKEQLVNKLFQECVHNLNDGIEQHLLDSKMTIREQFHYVLERLSKFADDHLDALLFIESHNNAYYLDGKSNTMFNEMLNFFLLIIEDGKKAGIMKDIPSKALMEIIYGAFVQVHKLIKAEILQKTPELMRGIEQSCWDAIRRH